MKVYLMCELFLAHPCATLSWMLEKKSPYRKRQFPTLGQCLGTVNRDGESNICEKSQTNKQANKQKSKLARYAGMCQD